MRKGYFLILTLILFHAVSYGASPDCPIVPRPESVTKAAGAWMMNKLKLIRSEDPSLLPLAHFLQAELLRHTSRAVPVRTENIKENSIRLSLDTSMQTGEEGYQLRITPLGAEIKGSSPHGVFNGIISLLQLIRVAAVNENPSIDCWQIEDAPQMTWRGLMLDESRHFFGPEVVKKIIDWMAFYKLNRFHWHLTDVPGWRIEIKSYPRLTLVGGVGNHSDSLAPARYYTQEQIREIVRYARDRFIEVIPEIDMPGHARAANRAYPAYSGGGSAKYPEFTFNPGKEETYAYLSKILREVDVLFPSKMIHLGGDEVHFGNEKWNTDPDVRSLMKKAKLPDLKSVEHYFIERMADSIAQLGAKVLGWDEIAGTRIKPDQAVIFWWRHNLPQTLRESIDKGYSVVLCPRIPFYFDFVQEDSHRVGRKWQGAYADLRSVYLYSPDQYGDLIPDKRRNQIAGIQANVWTEVIASEARLEYMLFPRISALAEAAWTDTGKRDYEKFIDRLSQHQLLYKRAGLYFFDAGSPETTPEIVR